MSWPITNPTYGTYQWLCLSVGLYLDYGADNNALSDHQDKYVDYIVQQGVQQFYNPPVMQGQSEPFCWDFLKIPGTLTLASGDYDYNLASDFGGAIFDVTWSVSDSKRRIQITDEYTVRSLQSMNASSGDPKYIAIRPKAVALTAEQAWEAVVYPTPSGTNTLNYRYKASTSALSTTNLYPLGTRAHAQTILYSCYSIAELNKNKSPGPMWQAFMQQLGASMQLDRQTDRGALVYRPVPDQALNDGAKG